MSVDLNDMDKEFGKERVVTPIERPDRLLPGTTVKIIHLPFVMEDEESGYVGLMQRGVDGHLGAVE